MRLLVPIVVAAVLPVTAAFAQQPAAAPASPRDTARTTVGDVSVLIDYGRPSKRGRVLFAADGLVPYGQVWRTGANAATTLVTSKDLMVGSTRVPAGTYTLYSVPSASGWQLVINKQTGQWGTVYEQAQDFARVPMQTSKLAPPVEQFAIVLQPAALLLQWDTVQASVPLRAVTR